MNNAPIGVFDSGIGGLSVANYIATSLPSENLIYIGDTKRVPYGDRDEKEITKFALQLVDTLLKKKVKVLVCACNTISSICLNEIKLKSPVYVIDVITPSIKEITSLTKKRHIAILGTTKTIESNIFPRLIKKNHPGIVVESVACPTLAPLIEDHLPSTPRLREEVQRYLRSVSNNIDVLHLGCTHYHVLKKLIKAEIPKSILITDSIESTTQELVKYLKMNNLSNDGSIVPSQQFYFTKLSNKVLKNSNALMTKSLHPIFQEIRLDE